jgi:hypothetical protein
LDLDVDFFFFVAWDFDLDVDLRLVDLVEPFDLRLVEPVLRPFFFVAFLLGLEDGFFFPGL